MENTENLIIEHLKALRNEVRDFRRDTEENFTILKNRISSSEDQLVGIHADVSGINRRMDRIDEKLVRIERRNELLDA